MTADQVKEKARELGPEERRKILEDTPESEIHEFLKKALENIYRDSIVEITHGSTEFGKDLVLVKKDPISPRTIGIIVIKGKVTGDSRGKIDKIRSQIEQAFSHPAKLRTTSEELDIKEVWIFIVGEISENGQKRIDREIKKTNVQVFGIAELIDILTEYYPFAFFKVSNYTIDFQKPSLSIGENNNFSLREQIKGRIRQRFNVIYNYYMTSPVTPSNRIIDAINFEICSFVLDPSKMIASEELVEEIADNHYKEKEITTIFEIKGAKGTKRFPWDIIQEDKVSKFIELRKDPFRKNKAPDCQFRRSQDGIIFWYNNGLDLVLTELTKSGTFFWKKYSSRDIGINLNLITCIIKASLVSFFKFYQILEYSGLIEIEITMDKLMHNKIFGYSREGDSLVPIRSRNDFVRSVFIPPLIIESQRLMKEDVALGICKKIYREFGYNLPEETFEDCRIIC